MTADQYVESILARYAVAAGPLSLPAQVGNAIAPTIRQWAGTQLADIGFSGSYAKGTPVRGGTDIDLFISLHANTVQSLSDIYNSLFSLASKNAWVPRRQNVSIGITYGGASVDLVPGKIQTGYQNYHSIYRRKADTWTQTNVALHINHVRDSQRTREIRAIKIWRNLHKLDFPSFYLELIVLEALKGRSTNNVAENVLHTLRYISQSLISTRIIDPANTNNAISDDLTLAEKQLVATQARASASQSNWGQIIW